MAEAGNQICALGNEIVSGRFWGAETGCASVVVTALEAAWRAVRASNQTEAPNRSPCGSVLL